MNSPNRTIVATILGLLVFFLAFCAVIYAFIANPLKSQTLFAPDQLLKTNVTWSYNMFPTRQYVARNQVQTPLVSVTLTTQMGAISSTVTSVPWWQLSSPTPGSNYLTVTGPSFMCVITPLTDLPVGGGPLIYVGWYKNQLAVYSGVNVNGTYVPTSAQISVTNPCVAIDDYPNFQAIIWVGTYQMPSPAAPLGGTCLSSFNSYSVGAFNPMDFDPSSNIPMFGFISATDMWGKGFTSVATCRI